MPRHATTTSFKPGHGSSPIENRFWNRLDKSGGDDSCWNWTGARLPKGYGIVGISQGKHKYTHRVAWELTNGPIPEGLWVLHRCDNPPCCNPAHLFIGNNRDNVLDMIQKGRAKRGPALGNQNWRGKKPP